MTEFVLSFLLFLVISVLDLFSKAGNRRSLEVATKPFIIPSLYLSIFMLASSMGGYLDHSYILVMGAVLYTAGDILLLWKNTMLFIVGVLSFISGHVFFISYGLLHSFSPLFLTIGGIAFLIPFFSYIRKITKNGKPDMFPGYVVYGLSVWALSTGMAATISLDDPIRSLLAVIGVIFFGYSDSRIAYNRTGHKETEDFTIMWTYIAANVLISSSMFMLGFHPVAL